MKCDSPNGLSNAIATLMIVETSNNLQNAYESYFLKYYNLISANSAEEAINLIIDGAKPEIIIAEHNLKDMEGADFLAESIKYLPDSIRILVFDENDKNGIYEKVGKSHSYFFLQKPFNELEVIQAVRVCFNHYSLTLKNKTLQNKIKLNKFNNDSSTKANLDSIVINVKEYNKIFSICSQYYYVNPQIIINNLLWKLSLKLENKSDDYRFLLFTLNLYTFKAGLFPERTYNLLKLNLSAEQTSKFIEIIENIVNSFENKDEKIDSLRFIDFFIKINIIKKKELYKEISKNEFDLYVIFEFILMYTTILFEKLDDKVEFDRDTFIENIDSYIIERKNLLNKYLYEQKDVYPNYLYELFVEIVDKSDKELLDQISTNHKFY